MAVFRKHAGFHAYPMLVNTDQISWRKVYVIFIQCTFACQTLCNYMFVVCFSVTTRVNKYRQKYQDSYSIRSVSIYSHNLTLPSRLGKRTFVFLVNCTLLYNLIYRVDIKYIVSYKYI